MSTDKLLQMPKRLLVFLLKSIYIAFFVLFCLWLLKTVFYPDWVYIPKSFQKRIEMAKTVTEITGKEEMIQKIEKHSDPIPRGHFHVTDEYIERLIHELDSNPPLCLKCHGTYPHRKDKKNSAILNLHHGFTACEICHVRKDPDDNNFYFAWADLKTGKLSDKADGGYGKYTAIIVPVKNVNGRIVRLDEEVGRHFSEEYLQMRDKYTPDQLAEVKKVHEHNLSKESVTCLDCHNVKGYIDYEALGYSKSRSNRLSSPDIPNMLTKYDKFYIPQMFAPDKMRKKQQ